MDHHTSKGKEVKVSREGWQNKEINAFSKIPSRSGKLFAARRHRLAINCPVTSPTLPSYVPLLVSSCLNCRRGCICTRESCSCPNEHGCGEELRCQVFAAQNYLIIDFALELLQSFFRIVGAALIASTLFGGAAFAKEGAGAKLSFFGDESSSSPFTITEQREDPIYSPYSAYGDGSAAAYNKFKGDAKEIAFWKNVFKTAE